MKTLIKILFIKWLYKAICFFSLKKQPQFSSILLLVPHPDDEILGLGGIMLQTLQQGGRVHLVYMTDGESSGVWSDKEEIKWQRISLSNMICEKLGLKPSNITRLHLPDGAVPYPGQGGFDETVQEIKELIERKA